MSTGDREQSSPYDLAEAECGDSCHCRSADTQRCLLHQLHCSEPSVRCTWKQQQHCSGVPGFATGCRCCIHWTCNICDAALQLSSAIPLSAPPPLPLPPFPRPAPSHKATSSSVCSLQQLCSFAMSASSAAMQVVY